MGVTTLELDTHLSADGSIVVWHDDVATAEKCTDTSPVRADDPDYPYAGDRIRDLTLAQIKTLDCGYQQLPDFPQQQNIPEARIPELSEVFNLVREADADTIRLNIETKVEDPGPAGESEMIALTTAVVGAIEDASMTDRTTLQSFDWASLNLAAELAPELPLVALAGDDEWLEVGQKGAAAPLGGLDIDDYDGSIVAAAADRGYDAVSPAHETVTEAMVDAAHRHEMLVVPWTVNERATMNNLIDAGVDGIITDYPTRLRDVMADRGMTLPEQYPVEA